MIEASAELIAALRAGSATRHGFVALDHPDGDCLAWTGVGAETWTGHGESFLDSNVFLGVHTLGQISGIEETAEIQQQEVAVSITGVRADLMHFAGRSVKGREARIWMRWRSDCGIWFPEKRTLRAGKMDYSVSEADGDESRITITIRPPMADWDKAPGVAYTHEEQQRLFPGDTGFDRIPSLTNKEITGWSTS